MKRRFFSIAFGSALLPIFVVAACSSSSTPASVTSNPDASTTNQDATSSAADSATSSDSSDANDTADVDKSATCAATFGSALTPAFGRIDGTVVAVVPPNDQACAEPNSTHLVIQVLMGGAVYRMVVDVLSDSGNPDVFFYEMDAPLASIDGGGGAFSNGWHATVDLDYVTTFNLHSTQFSEMVQADLVAKITSEINLGDNISIFATNTSAEPDSAHLVHRNLSNQDGAIVIRPDTTTPHYLLMRFSEQTF